MRFILTMAVSLSLLAAVQVHVAVADDADGDTTAVAQCDGLPPSVTIAVMTGSDTTRICREMVRVLEGVRRKDVTTFEKAAYVMQHNGYAKDGVQIAQELVEINRLRGLYDKPDRWYDTINLIVKTRTGFNGVVSPAHVITFLRKAGPDAAKGLSDDGLVSMIILMKRQYQSGDWATRMAASGLPCAMSRASMPGIGRC
jgi:hypothetical protein